MRICKGKYAVYDEQWRMHFEEFEFGYFHGWSIDYELLNEVVGLFPVAIVELPDGRVITPSAQNIIFIDAPVEKRKLETSVALL